MSKVVRRAIEQVVGIDEAKQQGKDRARIAWGRLGDGE